MADKVTTTKDLKLLANFYDNDTRTITRANPKNDLTAANIKTFQTWCVTNQPFIGDKAGTRFVRFTDARIIEKTVTDLDLTSN